MNKKLVAVNFTVEQPVERGYGEQMQNAFHPGQTYFGTAVAEDGQLTDITVESPLPLFHDGIDVVPAAVLESVRIVKEIAMIHK